MPKILYSNMILFFKFQDFSRTFPGQEVYFFNFNVFQVFLGAWEPCMTVSEP